MKNFLSNALSLCLLALLAVSLALFASAAPLYYLAVATRKKSNEGTELIEKLP